ncbi:hypothetical protein GCM10009864_33620 [Streptomyces lunalinharesii]|uniref:Transposase n=1 Tax=Streptomyces lunalinharesii TaxID=333384 RepID=A0ABP6EAT8_9ACTN
MTIRPCERGCRRKECANRARTDKANGAVSRFLLRSGYAVVPEARSDVAIGKWSGKGSPAVSSRSTANWRDP